MGWPHGRDPAVEVERRVGKAASGDSGIEEAHVALREERVILGCDAQDAAAQARDAVAVEDDARLVGKRGKEDRVHVDALRRGIIPRRRTGTNPSYSVRDWDLLFLAA